MERNIRAYLQVTWNIPGVATIVISCFALLGKKKNQPFPCLSCHFYTWISIIGMSCVPSVIPAQEGTAHVPLPRWHPSPADTGTCSWGQLSIDGNLLLGTELRWNQLFFQNKNRTHACAHIYKYWKEVFYPGIILDDLKKASSLILVQRDCFTSNKCYVTTGNC